MPGPRPPRIGRYELLEDYDAPDASIRIIEMTGVGEVETHVHQRSAQFYVALVGDVIVTCDGRETRLVPNQVFRVPRQATHGVRPAGHTATVMNISVPPLAADDQVAAPAQVEAPDMALPVGADVED